MKTGPWSRFELHADSTVPLNTEPTPVRAFSHTGNFVVESDNGCGTELQSQSSGITAALSNPNSFNSSKSGN